MSLLNLLYYSDWISSLDLTVFVILTPDHWCLESSLSVNVPFVKICLDELERFSFAPHLSLTCSSAFPSSTFLCHCPSAILSLFVFRQITCCSTKCPNNVIALLLHCSFFCPKSRHTCSQPTQSPSHWVHSHNPLFCLKLEIRHALSLPKLKEKKQQQQKLSHLQWHVSRLCEFRRYQVSWCLLSLDCNGTNWHIAYSFQRAENPTLKKYSF